MAERYIDLHIHTTASDGTLSPEELVKLAIEKKLSAIAVTDHDSISNVAETIKIGKERGLEVIPGIEISVDDDEYGFKDIHILGLFIDIENKELIDLIRIARGAREKQKVKMVKKLQELGYSITFEEVRKRAKGELGRPHIAYVLMEHHPKEFPTMDDVFHKLLGTGKKAYIERGTKTKLRTAIDAIKNSGGIAILSHPAVYADIDHDFIIQKFAELGGQGIETHYPYDKFKLRKGISREELENLIEEYRQKGKRYNLIESGGSDFHGTEKVDLGDAKVPYSVLEKMKELKKDGTKNFL